MTREQEIRERLEKITPPPWEYCPQDDETGWTSIVGDAKFFPNTHDADFISHAPTDIAYLLDALDKARGERDVKDIEIHRLKTLLRESEQTRMGLSAELATVKAERDELFRAYSRTADKSEILKAGLVKMRAERDAAIKERDSARDGWRESLDRLEAAIRGE